MSQLLAALLSFVLLYKYAAIFLVVFAAALAAPLPSGALTVASFFFASQGFLSFPWVAAAAFAGNVAGDLAGYGIVRRYGRPFLQRVGLGSLLQAPAVHVLERKIARHPGATIIVSRFTTAITPAANAFAALAPIPFRTFLAFDLIGEAGETAVNFAYGWLFGDSLSAFSTLTGRLTVLSLAAVALVFAVLRTRRRRTHAKPRP